MTYLILFLLIAAFLGGVIGWLFRGSCKKVLDSTNNKWSQKLMKNNSRWNEKIEKVKRDYAKSISNLNQEHLFIKNLLYKKETKQTIEKANWKKEREKLIKNNDNNLIHLNRELSIMRKKINIIQIEIKIKEKQLLNTNIDN